MVAALQDYRTAHRPMQGIIFGSLAGAFLWLAFIVLVVAI